MLTRGDTHKFLGMRVTFPDDRTVHVETIEYVKEAIEDFREPMDRGAATPALRNLFDIDGKTEELTPRQQQKLGSIVPKLLWVTKRDRPDIELPVAFLCTRISKCNSLDWKKLRRLLHFLYATINDVRFLSIENIGTMLSSFTFVDVAYVVHNDMRSHTGGGLSMGSGLYTCHTTGSLENIISVSGRHQ